MPRTAITLTAHTRAAAILVTLWTLMGVAAVILMSVPWTLMAVLRTVKTQLVPTLVVAMLDTGLMLMDVGVMVSNFYLLSIW